MRKTIEAYFKCSEKKITIDFFERAIFFMKKYIELKEKFGIEIDVSFLKEKFRELLKKEIHYIESEKERIENKIKSMEEIERTYKEFGVESLKVEWRKMWDWRWIFTKLDDIQEEIKKFVEEDISDRVKVLAKLVDVFEMAERYGFFRQMKSLVSERLKEKKFGKDFLRRVFQKIRKILETGKQ